VEKIRMAESRSTEVVQQDIKDCNVTVGSGHPWTGSGKEPQWSNPKSAKAYNHIERHHGPKKKPEELVGRATRTGSPQGQWLNEQDWVIAELLTPKHPGNYVINFKRPIGRVYHPDSTLTDNVTRAFVQRRTDGTINSAYPVTDDFVIKRGVIQ